MQTQEVAESRQVVDTTEPKCKSRTAKAVRREVRAARRSVINVTGVGLVLPDNEEGGQLSSTRVLDWEESRAAVFHCASAANRILRILRILKLKVPSEGRARWLPYAQSAKGS